ncbi:hypothetical protein Rs2_51052 [Raphanus sativus]|nr:hypothetical protein Rs2_51052 [Raphanus sativus]
MLVRIPSDYLRQKILEKRVWYVGDSMFQAVQWTSSASQTSPPLDSIQIWAHLTGIPLDLRHQQGLSLVAGLVGEPKETDDFTLNLVSLTLSHVKVAVDLTKPLPSVVEFNRESGEVVEVSVAYPWVPPTCSHCKELGHIMRNCLLVPLPPKPPASSSKANGKKQQSEQNARSSNVGKKQTNHEPEKMLPPSSHHPPSNQLVPVSLNSSPPSPVSFTRPPLKRPRSSPSSQSFSSFTAQLNFFTSPSCKPIPITPSSPVSSFLANPSSNPFTLLAPDGPLHHEEAID